MPHLAGYQRATTAVASAVLGKPEPWRRLLSGLLASLRRPCAEDSARYSLGSIAKRDIYIARGLNEFAVRGNELDSINRLRNRHVPDLVILITHHRSKMSFVR
jgi:hypothetical protein